MEQNDISIISDNLKAIREKVNDLFVWTDTEIKGTNDWTKKAGEILSVHRNEIINIQNKINSMRNKFTNIQNWADIVIDNLCKVNDHFRIQNIQNDKIQNAMIELSKRMNRLENQQNRLKKKFDKISEENKSNDLIESIYMKLSERVSKLEKSRSKSKKRKIHEITTEDPITDNRSVIEELTEPE